MASRPKFWPPQSFGLGLEVLASPWPRSRCLFMLSGIFRVKFGNFVNFFGNNLKSYVANHYLVLFHNYFWPRHCSPGLGLEVLALASRFWSRLTSLATRDLHGNGDDGNPAGMEANVAGFPREWKQMLWESRGNGDINLRDSRGNVCLFYPIMSCCNQPLVTFWSR